MQLIGMEATTPEESARAEDPGEQRLITPHRVATSLKPISCSPLPTESVRCNRSQHFIQSPTFYCLGVFYTSS